jgi:hypothetical protein
MANAPATNFRRHQRPGRGWWFCGGALVAAGLLFRAAEQSPGDELHTAAAVRGLTVEQAQQRTPVRLRGVVTFFDELLYSRFVQDDTAGIYLRESPDTPTLYHPRPS